MARYLLDTNHQGAALDAQSTMRERNLEEERGHESAPLADDGFREGFALEGDRLEDWPGSGIGGGGQA
jgi:hypothetical protein